MNDEKENDKSKPALMFIVLLLFVAFLAVSVKDRESVQTPGQTASVQHSADAIARCMAYNQRKSDTWWANMNSELANATARTNNELARLGGGYGYESTSQVVGCGRRCKGPQGFEYECTKDPSFIWQSSDGK